LEGEAPWAHCLPLGWVVWKTRGCSWWDGGVRTFASFRAAALIKGLVVVDLFVLASPGHMTTHLRGVPSRRLAATAYSLALA
jgi:hypothetical protein